MKKTVVFITPPSLFLLDERVFPAIGILRVAAVAESLGYTVEHLDLNGVVNYEEAVLNHCARTAANHFAITATTPQMVAVSKIRNVIRAALPAAKIIIGGPHPTLVHAAAIKTHSNRAADGLIGLITNFNVVVAGDGEEAIGIALEDGSPYLIDADNPKTDLFLTSKRIAELPLPARHLIDMDSYHYGIDGVRVTALIGQLGCPFGCNFCAGRDSAMLRRVRLRPTEHVIGEMRHIFKEYGIHGFMFFDDELNVNPQIMDLLNAIYDLQNELGVEFRCRGFVKSELFTEAQAGAMHRAGFRRVMCGFESGSDRILKNINKRSTKSDNTRTMDISHKYGLDMKALMSVGHPGESPDTIDDTRAWLLDVAPADFDITIITAYPGSPYYDRATRVDMETWCFETNGDKLYMKDVDYTKVEDFYKGSLDAYKSYVWTDTINAEDLVSSRDYVERHVRKKLGIPFYQPGAAVRFEASMGQLPGTIYRRSDEN
jgi:anaerobic magnesium-protoporphyrin IX monomethyl ester cyclase